MSGAGRGIRTLKGVSAHRVLSPTRLLFRHPGNDSAVSAHTVWRVDALSSAFKLTPHCQTTRIIARPQVHLGGKLPKLDVVDCVLACLFHHMESSSHRKTAFNRRLEPGGKDWRSGCDLERPLLQSIGGVDPCTNASIAINQSSEKVSEMLPWDLQGAHCQRLGGREADA